jgi:hypothetical protein
MNNKLIFLLIVLHNNVHTHTGTLLIDYGRTLVRRNTMSINQLHIYIVYIVCIII